MGDNVKTVDLKVKTPEFRLSFPALFEKRAFAGQKEEDAKYRMVMVFPKATDLTALKAVVRKAAEKKWPDAATRPKDLRSPFRDGSEKKDTAGFGPDVIFISASTKDRPGIVNRNLEDIIDREEVYAGCYCRATITPWAYDQAGNRGVSFFINNIQKLRDGDPLSSRVSAEKDFDALPEADPFGEQQPVSSGPDELFA